jgi:galactoside O-acetyltransferase
MTVQNQAYCLALASVGKDVVIHPVAKIVSPEVVHIGDSVIIDDFVFIMGGKKVVIGSFVHIGCFSSIAGGGELIMEDFSGLSGGVRIYTGSEDFSGACLTNAAVPYPYRKPIRSFVHLKKHAVIGANTTIMPGVTIGEGAVIGANSFVIRNCKPWTVYMGSPVKRLWERPKERILELETQLRRELYDSNGHYIPRLKE